MTTKFFSSLRWKITLLILFGAIVFSVITLFITYRYVNNLLTDSLIEQGRIVAGNLAEIAAEKLIEEDIVALRSTIEKYKYYSNIEYIIVEDFNHQIKTDTYNEAVPKEINYHNVYEEFTDNNTSVKLIELDSQNIEVYDILLPIKEGLLGFVRIGMKKSYVDEKIEETILYLSLVFGIGIFLAIILVLFIITLQITRPIVYLTEEASKISMGDFDRPVNIKVKNEIRILADSIERMRESLKTSIDRLSKR